MRAGCRPFLLVVFVFCWPAPSAALEVSGPPRVIDGDSLIVGGERIRLQGIDAPEIRQTCLTAEGRSWPCGAGARRALATLIAGRAVTCRGQRRDRYRRLIAVCHLSGRDLSAWMVARGWALAYRRYARTYTGLESVARAARLGLWAGRFTAPWDWRRGMRLAILKSSCRIAPAF